MRIGIDIRSLSTGKHTGVEEYIYNLLPLLFHLGKEDEFILLFNSFTHPVPQEVLKWQQLPNVRIAEYRWPSKLLNASLWFLGIPSLEKLTGDIDVMFFPNFSFTSTAKSIPRVITFHDLSFVHFPEFFNLYRRLWHWLVNPRMQARKAAKIISVSRSTACDLRKMYRVAGKKISVIPLGVAGTFFRKGGKNRVRERYNISNKPFVFFLGTMEPRKNIVSLIKAFDEFKKNTKLPHTLVIAGTRGWLFEEVFKAAEDSPYSKDIFFPGVIDTQDRPLLYKEADLFVFPSFFEGFGLPPLEALASGTPVICSANSSLIENIGSYGLLINPYDIGEIAWAMQRAASDNSLKTFFKKKGIEHAKKFDWEKTARRTLEVLRKAKRM